MVLLSLEPLQIHSRTESSTILDEKRDCVQKDHHLAVCLQYEAMTSVQERLAQEAQEVRKTFDRPRQSFRDITKDFISASEQLEAGQLVKDEWFTLFEAVGALEVNGLSR